MTNKRMWTGCMVAAGLSILGCNRGADVNKEVQDLKEAQQEAPKVASDLQRELDQKKNEVANLEEKVALAKQGVTDDVEKEKQDVKEAMQKEQQQVREEVNEAQGAARAANAEAQNAAQQLQQTESAQRVKAQVKTETTVVPSQTKTEVKTEEQNIPVENSKVIERTTAEPARTMPGDKPNDPRR